VTEDTSAKPKIIIDEDWKTQVEREKQSLEKEKARPADRASAGYQLPTASLATLISTLVTQTLISLGQVPDPLGGEAHIDLEQAKHFIDTLRVLEEKTKGNVTPQEKALMDNVLHELRLAYVAVQSHPAAAPSPPSA